MYRTKFLIIISLTFVACATEDIRSEATVVSVAEAFLTSVDQGNYQESWLDASELLRANVQQDDWVDHLKDNRESFDVLKHREVDSVMFDESLEGLPDGEYALLRFATSFENNRGTGEVVGLALDADSMWRVVGYYID